jgi:predicted N-formylglutamate amidohydrolase
MSSPPPDRIGLASPSARPLEPEPLLASGEPPAYEVVNAGGAGSAFLVCDHASNLVPRSLRNLGLEPARLAEHIAWDPGAAEVSRRLSGRLDAPLLLTAYSRLVIDCNRPLDSRESITEQSAGVTVPGNLGLTAGDRALRIDGLFRPYHEAIARLLDRRAGRPSLLLSIHSFTPELDGQRRPWDVAISYGRDRRLAALMLDVLKADANLVVGDNEPYPVDDAIDYTIPAHGEGRGLPNVLIEIRQDGVATPAGAAAWAMRLAKIYARVEPAALRLRMPR